MNVFLTSAYKTHHQLDVMLRLADSDSHGVHHVADCAEDADVILFVEDAQFDDYFYSTLRQHPLLARFPEKTFMYNEVDYPWCTLPGLYCSMPAAGFQHTRQMAFPYLSNLNPHVSGIYESNTAPEFLYSFVGSASHRSRRDVLALRHTPTGAAIHDTSRFDAWKCVDTRQSDECALYADTIARSHYVLCPRGLGTSSSRLFESLEAGRAPVIISDHWIAPPHLDWSFAVRVPEAKVADIPDILQSIKHESDARGKAARLAWEKAYSDSALFNTAISSIEVLRGSMTQRCAAAAPSDKLYRTRLQLEHSVRAIARVVRNLQSDMRFG